MKLYRAKYIEGIGVFTTRYAAETFDQVVQFLKDIDVDEIISIELVSSDVAIQVRSDS
jgi:hypothetical protein